MANELIEKFVEKTEKLKVGDPLSDDTDIGPVVNSKSLENMEGIVNRTIKEGAELISGGGERIKNKGYFFAPTILKNVLPDMEIAQEEVYENADFSIDTIKASIKEGECKTKQILKDII